MALLLHRLGAFAHRRRRAVLAGWLLVLVVVGALAGTVGGSFNDDFKSVVERFVSNLRRKIDFGGPSLIHTVRGFGYSLRPAA